MEETIETPVITSADDVVAAIVSETATDEVELCLCTSPNGIFVCELTAHSDAVPHQATVGSLDGPRVTYWF